MFDLDLADVKPSVFNAITLTLTVVITINFLKFLMSKFPVPGLAPLIQNT